MKTMFLLMAEFGQADIPLELVAEKYLNMDKVKASRNANKQALPFPVFRAGSQKSSWMVHIADLAEFIDKARDEAKREWTAINGG